MVKFDCAGVLMSRHIGLQPYPSRPVSVNAFCLGFGSLQDIHFRGSSPPTDYVFLYKTSIGCILPILNYNDAKFNGQYSLLRVDITVQTSESGLIMVYLHLPQTGTQNGIGCLLQKVICLPNDVFDVLAWMHCLYARVRDDTIWWH